MAWGMWTVSPLGHCPYRECDLGVVTEPHGPQHPCLEGEELEPWLPKLFPTFWKWLILTAFPTPRSLWSHLLDKEPYFSLFLKNVVLGLNSGPLH